MTLLEGRGDTARVRIAVIVAIAASCAAFIVPRAAAQSLQTLSISGPTQIYAGETARYTLYARYDNGYRFDVTLCGTLWVEESEFAWIDRFGRLSTAELTEDRIVNVRGSFSDGSALAAVLPVAVIAAAPQSCDAPSFTWARSFGGVGDDLAEGFAVDASGNAWIVGSFEGSVDFDPTAGVDIRTAAGVADAFITHLHSDGSYGWTRTFSGSGLVEARGVAVGADGDAYVAGSFDQDIDLDPGSGTVLRESQGGSDVFVVKLGANGTYVWGRALGGVLDDDVNDVALDRHAGGEDVLVCGGFAHQVDFDPGPGEDLRVSGGGRDLFVQKLDSAGAHQWVYTVGGLHEDEARAVAVDGAGNVVVAGRYRGIVDFDPGRDVVSQQAVGGSDVCVVQVSASGAFRWVRTVGGVSTDGGEDIAATPLGDIVVTGYFWETVDFNPGSGVDNRTSHGQGDVFIMRLTASGGYRWTRTLGGAAVEEAFATTVDPSGSVFFGGRFRGSVDLNPGTGADVRAALGGDDAYVIRIDPDGDYEWAVTLGGAWNDETVGIATTASGSIFVLGRYQDLADLDPTVNIDPHESNGGTDAFIVRLQCGEAAEFPPMCDAPAFTWARAFGGAGDDLAEGYATDAVGNSWIVGSFEGTVDFDPTAGVDIRTAAGVADAFVTHLRADGSYGWTRTLSGSGLVEARGVAVGGSGDVYIVGSFDQDIDLKPGSGAVLRESQGQTDAFVVKLGAAGAYLWGHTFGGPLADEATDVAVDTYAAAEDLLISGQFSHQVDFDPGPGEVLVTSNGSSDLFALKLGSTGAYRWVYTAGGLHADEARAVAVDSAGNVSIAGRFRTVVNFNAGASADLRQSEGGPDAFVTQLAPDGVYRWTRTFGGASTDVAHDVAVSRLGDVIVTGSFWDVVDFAPGAATDAHQAVGQGDVFVTRLRWDGSYRWTKTFGGSGMDEGCAIAADAYENALITGYFRGTVDFDPGSGSDLQTAAGADDAFLVKLTDDGSQDWAVTLGGPRIDTGAAVAADPAGRISLAGHFEDTADLDPTATDALHAAAGARDVLVVRLQCGDSGRTGDLDGDGLTDAADFAVFSACLTGPHEFPLSGCDAADLDYDSDVDLQDYALLLQYASEAGYAPAPPAW